MILGGNFWSWPSDLWVSPRLAQTRDRIRSSNCMDTKLLKKLQRKQANKEANPTKRSMQCCPSTWCKFCGHHPYIHTLTIMFLANPDVCHAILELGTDNICGINLQSYNPNIYYYIYTICLHIPVLSTYVRQTKQLIPGQGAKDLQVSWQVRQKSAELQIIELTLALWRMLRLAGTIQPQGLSHQASRISWHQKRRTARARKRPSTW